MNKPSRGLTVRQEVLSSECIFRKRDVAANGSVVEGEDLTLVLKFVLAALALKTIIFIIKFCRSWRRGLTPLIPGANVINKFTQIIE